MTDVWYRSGVNTEGEGNQDCEGSVITAVQIVYRNTDTNMFRFCLINLFPSLFFPSDEANQANLIQEFLKSSKFVPAFATVQIHCLAQRTKKINTSTTTKGQAPSRVREFCPPQSQPIY